MNWGEVKKKVWGGHQQPATRENTPKHRMEPGKHPETTPVETSYNSIAVQ